MFLLAEFWHYNQQVGVDHQGEQAITHYQLQYKLPQASLIDNIRMGIGMKAYRQQPEQDVIKFIPEEFFHC